MPLTPRHIAAFLTLLLLACNDRPKPPRPDDQENRKKIEGKVAGYAANADGDIDHLLLAGNGDTTALHFPPHTARAVQAFAAINTIIQVETGAAPPHGPHPPGSGHTGLELLTLQHNDTTLRLHDLPPPRPFEGRDMATGGPFTLRYDGTGTLFGIEQSGHLVVVPPRIRTTLTPLLRSAQTVSSRGFERNPDEGFVNLSGLPLLRPYQVTIDGTTYLIQRGPANKPQEP